MLKICKWAHLEAIHHERAHRGRHVGSVDTPPRWLTATWLGHITDPCDKASNTIWSASMRWFYVGLIQGPSLHFTWIEGLFGMCSDDHRLKQLPLGLGNRLRGATKAIGSYGRPTASLVARCPRHRHRLPQP
jgi:hypothetical protein